MLDLSSENEPTTRFGNLPLRAKISLGSCAPLIFVAAFAAVALFSLQALRESEAWVTHTHGVIERARKLEKLVVDLETGQRGFLITGRETFLEPYTNANNSLDAEFTSLSELVDDNPPQVARITGVERLLNEWREEAGTPEIDTRRAVNAGTASMSDVADLIQAEVGKALMDEMRAVLAEFVAVEEELLIEREVTAGDRVYWTRIAIAGGGAATLVSALVLAFLIARAITRPVGNLLQLRFRTVDLVLGLHEELPAGREPLARATPPKHRGGRSGSPAASSRRCSRSFR